MLMVFLVVCYWLVRAQENSNRNEGLKEVLFGLILTMTSLDFIVIDDRLRLDVPKDEFASSSNSYVPPSVASNALPL